MSVKRLLAEEIEALPDTLTVEEAVDCLYRAFKLKRARMEATSQALKREQLKTLFGSLSDDPLERPPCR